MTGRRKHRAIVERFNRRLVGDIVSRERARMAMCGCSIFVGLDSAHAQPATRSQACSEDHQILVERADAILREMQTAPVVGRELVMVCVEALHTAALEIL
jgi:hypothetical protein